MRRLPALLITILFAVPLLLAALFTVGISTWALDRGFYTALLSDTRLYEIPDSPLRSSLAGVELSGIPALSTAVSPKALREILTPAYLRGQATGVVNQVFDILDDRSETNDIAVDLVPVKAALMSKAGTRFARALAEGLPVGGTASGFAMTPERFPQSRPSTVSVDRAAAVIKAGLPALARALPDALRLSDAVDLRELYFPWGTRPHIPVLGILIVTDVVLLVIALGFLLAAGFARGATLYGRLQWWGWGLAAPAFFVFLVGILAVIGAGLARWGISTAGLEIQGFSASFVAAVADTARHAVIRVGVGFLATGAIACGLGFGLLGWSWSLPVEERAATRKGE